MNARRLIGVLALVAGAAAAASDSTTIVPPDGRIKIVVNAIEGTAQVSPSAQIRPGLTRDYAARSRLRPNGAKSQVNIGPISLPLLSSSAMIEIAGVRRHRDVTWTLSREESQFDATMGPMDIPTDIVVFELNAPAGGERDYRFPLSDFSAEGGGYGLAISIGADKLRIFFKPTRPNSLATATAGSLIALKNGGRLSGEPRSSLVANGILRPAQTIALARPLVIGPLSLSRFDARIADYGNTRVGSSDPNEIVVTGTVDKKPQFTWLTIGGDDVAHCSSLTMNKQRMILTLRCRPKV